MDHYKRYATGNVLSMVAGFVSFPVTSRLLSSAEFGVMGYWDAWILLLVAILKLGAGDAMLRFYPHGGDRAAHVRYATNLILIPGLLGTGGWLIALAGVLLGLGLGWIEHPAVALSAMFLVLIQIWVSHVLWCMATRELSALGASANVIWRWLTVGSTLAVLMFVTQSASGVFVARLVPAILVVGALLWWLFQNTEFSKPAVDIPYVKEGLHYGVPLALKELSNVVMAFIDRIMLKALLGDFALVGTYSIGFALASYVDQVVSVAVGQAWTPTANRIYATEGAAGVRAAKARMLRPLTYVCVGLATGVLLAGHSFVAVLAGAEKAVQVAPIFVFAAVCLLMLPVLTVSNTGLLLERRSRTLFLLTLAAALVNVALNFVLIPRFAVMGATWSNIACQLGLQLVIYAYCPKALRCLPSLSVLLRALALATLCGFVAQSLVPPGMHPVVHCLYIAVCMVALYALPVVATDKQMRQAFFSLWGRYSPGA